jgi:DUF971 family protein
MWTVVTDVYNVFTAPHIHASIFNWKYLRCHWRYLDNSMSVILQTWWQIQRTSPSLRYVNYVPDIRNVFTAHHIQASIFNWTYLRCYCRHLDYSMSVLLLDWCQMQCTAPSLRDVNCGPAIYNVITATHIQASIFNWTHLRCYCRYFDISMRVVVPNTAYVLQFTLFGLRTQTYAI